MANISLFGQSFMIPSPSITGKTCPDQKGKVHIVTGGYTGCGYELARILYSANANVYIMGRSTEKANKAIADFQRAFPAAEGKVEFIELDLADLKTIKPAVEAFTTKESRLDVLTNNAGVMFPPAGSKTAQGFELQMGTNCLGHFLLNKLLRPLMEKTAADSPAGSVRVSWAASLAVEVGSYKPGGICLDEDGKPMDKGVSTNYGQSKVGNIFFATESVRRFGEAGVIHTCFNPGNLQSELQRHMPAWQAAILNTALYAPVYGGYTELFCAVSPDVTPEKNGSYVVPWGRFGTYRADIVRATKPEGTGGNGKAEKFWNWCETVTEEYC